MDWGAITAAAARELAMAAAIGFAIGGLDDLAIDLIWAARAAWRRLFVYTVHPPADAGTLPRPMPGRLAVFVPAWREEAVIGAMIAHARATVRHRDVRVYVGCYPNDPATIAAARAAAGDDPRLRIVVGDADGPTTKAGCLNWCWQAMLADEARDHRRVKAVILHDAEDVVHRDELAVYDALCDRFALVQLPVAGEPVRGRGWWAWLVSSHYSSEFAEAHGKQIVVREALGAAVPSAGVGCAVSRHALARAAAGRAGPFDPGTLTEDYELGLRIGAAGGRGAFVRLPAADGRGVVAVHACFPHTLRTASRQKARWIAGIALAGWDRLGWQGGLAERWMRLRDRRAPAAALLLACAYGALPLWAAAAIAARLGGDEPPVIVPAVLIHANLALLGWRVAVRAGFAGAAHGWRMALCTPAHMVIGNLVAMAAGARAMALYTGIVRTGRVRWDKTMHVFPTTGG